MWGGYPQLSAGIPLRPEKGEKPMTADTEFRKLVKDSLDHDRACVVSDEVDPWLELSAIAAKKLGTTVFFEKLKGYPGFRAVTELLSSDTKCERFWSKERGDFLSMISTAAVSPQPCRVVEKAHFTRRLKSLDELPLPRFFSSDGGKYITGGMILIKYPESDACNISFNRLMQVDSMHLAFNIHKGKHTDLLCRDAEEKGRRIPAAVVIGTDPAVMIAASAPAPWGTDELAVASAIRGRPLDVVRGPYTGLPIPAESEIVIEGYIETDKVPEGPFVDYLGVMHGQGTGRLFSVEKVYCAENPIFHALMPGNSQEHLELMSLPVEAEIAQRLRKLTRFVDVTLTRSSGLFHVVASIRKSTDGEAKTALLAMLSSYPFLKHAVVVDENVNIRSIAEVEKAIALCVQADQDVIIVSGAKATMVDPRSTSDLLGAKMGLDATRPINAGKEKFQAVPWPETEGKNE